MNANLDAPRPEINVCYNKNEVNKSVITQVLLGIEEEGIPFTLSEANDTDSVSMAYKAAELSHLGVGIGISNEIVLHFVKLKEGNPLFSIPITATEEDLRTIGSNAARLVKRMPFKYADLA